MLGRAGCSGRMRVKRGIVSSAVSGDDSARMLSELDLGACALFVGDEF